MRKQNEDMVLKCTITNISGLHAGSFCFSRAIVGIEIDCQICSKRRKSSNITELSMIYNNDKRLSVHILTESFHVTIFKLPCSVLEKETKIWTRNTASVSAIALGRSGNDACGIKSSKRNHKVCETIVNGYHKTTAIFQLQVREKIIDWLKN